jgi:hypothetical protein
MFLGKHASSSSIRQVTIVLALATLGFVTKNRNDPISVALSKVSLPLA